eukprot:TRINITY_DN1044_c0_g1_i2.p1 TRINITY_DN1044_c0_g1~~TRINITY_DN1044_c0_g1_i2.p1  ORF type:complete len:212 (-),score=42.37 TRINITY_DN1044_c0_g1_i2:49-684(-)
MSTTLTTPIKLILDNGEIRRISVPSRITFTSLVSTISSIVPLGASPVLSYVDDESDVCSVTSNAELYEAFRVFKSGSVLRLKLSTQPISRNDFHPATSTSELRTHQSAGLNLNCAAQTIQREKKEAVRVDLMQELRNNKCDDKRAISSNSEVCKKEAACVSLMRDIRNNKPNLKHVMTKPGRLAFLKYSYKKPRPNHNLMIEIRERVPLAL